MPPFYGGWVRMRQGSCFYGIIPAAMTIEDKVNSREFQSVVEDYRGMCLWFAGDVLHPKNRVQLELVLSSIEANGDVAAYKRVGRIRRWL